MTFYCAEFCLVRNTPLAKLSGVCSRKWVPANPRFLTSTQGRYHHQPSPSLPHMRLPALCAKTKVKAVASIVLMNKHPFGYAAKDLAMCRHR